MVKGGEPDTLHSISPAFPTTVLQSFNVLENVGGMVLSVREGNEELVVHRDKYKCKCSVINRAGCETSMLFWYKPKGNKTLTTTLINNKLVNSFFSRIVSDLNQNCANSRLI